MNDPNTWAAEPDSGSITIPHWLGGAWTVRYIIQHRWTHWLVLWPIIKWRKLTGGAIR